jgi:hypothetical protein
MVALACSANEPVSLEPQAARLAFLVNPSDVTTMAPMTPAVQVALVDTLSGIVRGADDSVTVALRMNASGATLSGTTTVRAVAGVATFDDLHVSNASGGFVLVVTAGRLPPLISQPFEVVATQLRR